MKLKVIGMKTIYVALMILTTSVGFAQTTTWISGVPGFWNNAANWDNGVPVAGVAVVFNNTGVGNCIIDIPGAVATTLTITAGYTGNIDLNGNTLAVGPGGNHRFLGGTFTNGIISITGNSGAEFDGTDLAASVTLNVNLGTAAGVFEGDGGTTFGGPVTVTAHSILLDGSTYNDLTSLTKTSAAAPTASLGEGGNIFNGTTIISNAMNEVFRTASAAGDTFNGQLTLSLDGTSPACKLELAYGAGTTTSFNNNVRVKTANNSGLSSVFGGFIANNAWISFGQTAAPLAPPAGGLSSLATGFTIREEAGANAFDQERDLAGEFLWGDLVLNNFTQSGATAQGINFRIPNLLPTDPSVTSLRLLIKNSTFNGSVTFSASNFYISGSTFNGLTNSFTKTVGSGSDSVDPPPSFLYTWDGGNTFNNTTTIDNRGQCTMVLGGTTGDTFNGNVTFSSNQDLSSYMIANIGTTSFKGNIILVQNDVTPSPPNINFGFSGGAVVLDGSAVQALNSNASIPRFRSLTIKNASGITTNTPTIISNNLDLVSGIVTLDDNDYMSFLNDATVTNAKDESHVDGIVRKTGNDAFIFPIGDEGAYHPLGISAPASITSEFSAEYFLDDHGVGAAADGGMVKVSDCEFWVINRTQGTDVVSATLYWNSPSSFCHTDYITSGFESQLQVARWSGSLWNNLGHTNLQGAAADGTDGHFTSSVTLPDANLHVLTFGSLALENMLPVTLLAFDVVPSKDGAVVVWQTASEHDNDYFTIERMQKNEFFPIAKVRGAGTTKALQDYRWTDRNPLSGLSYYRLKQTDFNGSSSYSEVVALELQRDGTPYPNPVKNILHLDGLGIEKDSKVSVTDVTGHSVLTGKGVEKLDVSSLKPGIYHVAVQSGATIKWYSIKKE